VADEAASEPGTAQQPVPRCFTGRLFPCL